jgi:hypothetical protein
MLPNHIIKTTIKGKFKVYPTTLIIDFNPIIQDNNLTGNFVLGHWNKVFRLPAYYDGETGEYYTCQEKDINTNNLPYIWVCTNKKILPSSVLLHEKARVVTLHNILNIISTEL